MTISIQEMQKQVHSLAREKGWWPLLYNDEDKSEIPIEYEQVNIPEKLMLMVSELGEALEHYRGENGLEKFYWESGQHPIKPDGFWIELADTVIRILDLAGAYNIDMEALIKEKHAYNKTRPYRHGGKRC